MRNSVKVNIIFIIISAIAIFITIFALSRSGYNSFIHTEEYERNIQLLTDTIVELRNDIARYEKEIERIDLERETIRKELELIINDNEKTDSELIDGDLDHHIHFLTEYLSKEASDRE